MTEIFRLYGNVIDTYQKKAHYKSYLRQLIYSSAHGFLSVLICKGATELLFFEKKDSRNDEFIIRYLFSRYR